MIHTSGTSGAGSNIQGDITLVHSLTRANPGIINQQNLKFVNVFVLTTCRYLIASMELTLFHILQFLIFHLLTATKLLRIVLTTHQK